MPRLLSYAFMNLLDWFVSSHTCILVEAARSYCHITCMLPSIVQYNYKSDIHTDYITTISTICTDHNSGIGNNRHYTNLQ